MKRFVSVLMACSTLFVTSLASAAPVYDFTARLLNIGLTSTQPARLVSVYTQDAANLSGRGSITVHFIIRNVGSGNSPVGEPLFDGEATINAGETSVVVGAANTGRITLTYDPAADRLETQFVMRFPGASIGAAYEIHVWDSEHSTKALIFGALG